MDISGTEIKTFLDCKRKYFLAYKENLKPVLPNFNLEDGTIIHDAVFNYHTNSPSGNVVVPGGAYRFISRGFQEAYLPYFDTILKRIPDELNERSARLLGMFAGYTKLHSPKEFLEYQGEKSFRINYKDISVVGKKDGIVTNFDGETRLIEYKSTSTNNVLGYIEAMEDDIQPILYLWAHYIETGEVLDGVLYRCFKKPRLKQRIGESNEAFCDRIIGGYLEDPENRYFEFFVDKNHDDLLWFQEELDDIVEEMSRPRKIYPRNTQRCHDWGICPFYCLCRGKDLDHSLINQYFYKKTKKHEEVDDVQHKREG